LLEAIGSIGMLTEFTLENFRGFKGFHRIPLSEITLLYGANSSGKSSILKGLNLISGGGISDIACLNMKKIGSRNRISPNMFYNHDVEQSLGFGIGLSGLSAHFTYYTKKIFVKDFNKTEQKEPISLEKYCGLLYQMKLYNLPTDKEICFVNRSCTKQSILDGNSITLELKDDNSVNSYLEYLLCFSTQDFETKKISRNALFEYDTSELKKAIRQIKLVLSSEKQKQYVKIVWPENEPHVEILKSQSGRLLLGLHDILENLLFLNKRIGPLRSGPESFSASKKLRHYNEGDFSISNSLEKCDINLLNDWLEKMDVPYEVISTKADYFLVHNQTKLWHTFDEVGFGVCQVLPILIGGMEFESPEKSMVKFTCIEQPETHLHPKMQGNLADFFIETISSTWDYELESRDDWPDPDLFYKSQITKQWLIETHSEALLRRVKRRIREGVISKDKISVMCICKRADNSSVVVTIHLDDEGDFISEWPGGFFEEDFDDMYGDLFE
jgi:predicted ATPase